MPINRIGNAAYHHDLCYSKHDDTKTRNEVYDKTMLGLLSRIVNPTLRERIEKFIVGKLIRANLKFTNDLADEFYKPVSKKFQIRRVNVNIIDEIWLLI